MTRGQVEEWAGGIAALLAVAAIDAERPGDALLPNFRRTASELPPRAGCIGSVSRVPSHMTISGP